AQFINHSCCIVILNITVIFPYCLIKILTIPYTLSQFVSIVCIGSAHRRKDYDNFNKGQLLGQSCCRLYNLLEVPQIKTLSE
ncbi:MAG: hypothetical protein AAF485_15715, partial [Chloroflexota bacterium]